MKTPTGVGPATFAIAYRSVPLEPGYIGIVTVEPPTIGAPLVTVVPLATPMYTIVVLTAATVMVTVPTPGGTVHSLAALLVTLPGMGMIIRPAAPRRHPPGRWCWTRTRHPR